MTMNIDALTKAIEGLTTPVPFDKALWSDKECGEYFKMSPRNFRETISCRPGFPKFLPLGETGRTFRWKAIEVIEWAESLFE